MKAIKLLTVVSVLTFSTLSASAYTTVKCDTDPAFAANSCNVCFLEAKGKWEGSNLGFLKDEWINNSTSDKILYKVEQEMPKMINLSPSLVEWTQTPKTEFWEYPKSLNDIYDDENEGYVLAKGKKVTWIQSKKWAAFTLKKNKVAEGKNIGLLKYNLTTHNISANGDINTDWDEHTECVLYKSGKKVEKAVVVPGKKATPKAPAKKLPKTGPEHYILFILLSMILAFWVMKLRRKA